MELERYQCHGLGVGRGWEESIQFQTRPGSAREVEQRPALRWGLNGNWGIRNFDTGAGKAHRGE